MLVADAGPFLLDNPACAARTLLAEVGVAVPVQRPHTPVILFAEAT